MLDEIGVILHWAGTAGAIGTATLAVVNIWRQQPRPSGRISGRGVTLLTGRRYTIIVTIVYVAAMILFWKPLPIPLSQGIRFAFDAVGFVILLFGLTLYL